MINHTFIFLNLIQGTSCVCESTININCTIYYTQSGYITVV